MISYKKGKTDTANLSAKGFGSRLLSPKACCVMPMHNALLVEGLQWQQSRFYCECAPCKKQARHHEMREESVLDKGSCDIF